jgi:parvulin-like peptidyl-prolyl cis-trans isomerase-like protein
VTTVPDDAFALVDGTAIPRDAFEDAVVQHASSGPASRDDRGLRQRIALAIVTRELVKIELDKLGAKDVETRALPLVAALAQVPTPRGDASLPSWWVRPPLQPEELAAAVIVADAIAGQEVTEQEIAAEYQRQKDRWSSEEPWVRLDTWTIEFSDATGIAACDDYVAKYRRCTAKFPAATRPNVLADLRRQANAWREQAGEPERRMAAGNDCEASTTEALQQTASMGCDWQSDADADERRATAARKSEASKLAESARARIAAGEDPLAVAAALGGRAELHRMMAMDELPKAVAKAAKKAAPGTFGKPIDDGRAWTIIRVIDRQPAGTLEPELVHDELAADLRTQRLADALERLPDTLRERHEVTLHADYESLDASPDGAGL